MSWTDARVLKQIELGEDSRVEFKEVFFGANCIDAPERRDVADELAALGNTVGGTLIFSVSDAGEVRPMNREQMDELEKFVREICRDSVSPEPSIISQRVALPDNRAVLVVEVRQSASVHRSPGGYMHRHGSEKRQLSPDALDRLFQNRGRSGRLGPDETIVAGTGRNTLDAALVDRLMSSRATEAVDAQLLKLGLLREGDNGATGATVAGVLLCAERPDAYIGGAAIEAVRYDGDPRHGGSARCRNHRRSAGSANPGRRQVCQAQHACRGAESARTYGNAAIRSGSRVRGNRQRRGSS